MRATAATAAMSPKVTAAPLLSPIELTIMPAIDATKIASATQRMVEADIGPLPGQRLVLDAVRLVGVGAELLAADGLVLAEVALEPAHLAVALEGEHVGGDAVEEPAVVADDHRAAGVGVERVLQRPQRVDVEVVGGLVEQQDVAALLQQLGQVHPVALSAGEHADLLLLVAALEVERGDVGPTVDLAA